jgi:hypothetical protein
MAVDPLQKHIFRGALKSDQINLLSILLNAIGVGIFEVPEVDSAISRHCKKDE